MKSLKSFFSQTFYYGFSSVFARVLNFFLVPLYTRMFTDSEYGLVTVLYSCIVFIFIISSLGMEAAFFRFINREKNKKEVYATAGLILISSSILILFLGEFILKIIPQTNQYLSYIIWIFLIVFLDTLCVLPFAKLRQEEKAKKFAIIKTANIIFNIFFNIFFLVICPILETNNYQKELIGMLYSPDVGIGYIFISNLLASGLTFLMLLSGIYKLLKWKYFSLILAKKMLSYSFPLVIAGLAYATNEVADKIMLSYFLDTGKVGIYGACYKLSIFMILFVQAYRYTIEPYYFNNHKKENFKKMYVKIMRYFIIISLFIFLSISLNKEYIIQILGTKGGYREGVVIIPIVLMAHLFLGIYYNLSLWYKLTNKTYFGALISIGGALITIILNLLLIPKIGYIGSAWATFFCYFFMAITSYTLSIKYYFVPYEKIKTIFYFIVAVGIYLFGNYFEIKDLGNNILLIALYLCIVFVCEKLNFKKHNEASIL